MLFRAPPPPFCAGKTAKATPAMAHDAASACTCAPSQLGRRRLLSSDVSNIARAAGVVGGSQERLARGSTAWPHWLVSAVAGGLGRGGRHSMRCGGALDEALSLMQDEFISGFGLLRQFVLLQVLVDKNIDFIVYLAKSKREGIES